MRGTPNIQDLIRPLVQKNNTKIVLIVLDGVGGLPGTSGKTELESANTPNLDGLAQESACGMHIPVALGITPGSGPGHLGIFGYNPTTCQIGRGILETLGLGLEVKKSDIAVRCNYATIRDGVITDRRAGRIPTEEGKELTEKLKKGITKIDEAEIILEQGMEYRFAVLMRFPEALEPDAAMISDTDPQQTGKQPLQPAPLSKNAEKISRIAEKFIYQAHEILKDEEKANFILMRGFSTMPHIPTYQEAFGLNAIAIATYPMYRGLARLVEMDTPAVEGSVEGEIKFLHEKYDDYDFFFVHVKKIDSFGVDGDFKGKAERIDEFDRLLPEVLRLSPDVLIITGDHSTPCVMKNHSWHPVPVLLKSPYVLGEICRAFSERECLRGELGIFPAMNLMPLALAHAGRLKKFGA
ncbi:MAG: 2,3-bisphosphoglycerate-independent phosphoglycerate mutase [Nitrospiraceae bacterium]|nr:MAG: 2,3-bisphosphoglycerate-independent phosphoglycerate mutase [Nitrospiraceae bacterium]